VLYAQVCMLVRTCTSLESSSMLEGRPTITLFSHLK
jgi:hypothetical protein